MIAAIIGSTKIAKFIIEFKINYKKIYFISRNKVDKNFIKNNIEGTNYANLKIIE